MVSSPLQKLVIITVLLTSSSFNRILETTLPHETTHPHQTPHHPHETTHVPKTENDHHKPVVEDEENEISEAEYFSKPSKNFRCVDHIKIMEVGYSCMDSKSMEPQDIGVFVPDDIKGIAFETIFVVSKNGRKYFMKIVDHYYDLEMKLQRMFVDDLYTLWFLEYKIIKNRFVGIYMYMGQRNTMRYHLENNTFSVFEKLVYLNKLVTMASDFFTVVNPQNNLIQLNITPSNTLLFKNGFQTFRLINFLVTDTVQKERVLAPEYFDSSIPVNQKASCVYSFGKIIFFYLFGRIHRQPLLDQEPEVQALLKQDPSSHDVRVMQYLIHISRAMLNTNPVDRPSLEQVMSQFQKGLDVLINPWEIFKMELFTYKATIKRELQNELYAHEDNVRIMTRQQALKDKTRAKKGTEIKDKRYEQSLNKIEEKGQQFYDFVGMESKCDLKPTFRMTNYLDTFGFVPALNSLIEEVEVDVEGNEVLKTQENHANDDPDNLKKLRMEYFLIMGVSLFIICIVMAYFSFKGMEIKMYQKHEFPASLILY